MLGLDAEPSVENRGEECKTSERDVRVAMPRAEGSSRATDGLQHASPLACTLVLRSSS